MEMSTLLHWRRLVPASMFAVIFAPYLLPLLDKLGEFVWPGDSSGDYLKALSIAIFLVVGHIYDASEIRWKFADEKHRSDDVNKEMMIETLLRNGICQAEINAWGDQKKSWKRLLFSVVDNEPSVGAIGKRIYEAGFNWSSFADGAIILLFLGLSMLVVSTVTQGGGPMTIYYGICIAIGVFASLSKKKQMNRHLELCKEQQIHIRLFCADLLRSNFKKALNA